MTNPVFEKLSTALENGVLFGHSIEEAAQVFLKSIPEYEQDKVNVLISGDTRLTSPYQISRQISAFLQFFELRDNIRILTGNLPGVETIVQRYARNNRIECVVFQRDCEPDIADYGNRGLKSRNRDMVNRAHVVLLLTAPNSKASDSMYQLARSNGRLIAKRYIGPKK